MQADPKRQKANQVCSGIKMVIGIKKVCGNFVGMWYFHYLDYSDSFMVVIHMPKFIKLLTLNTSKLVYINNIIHNKFP